MPPVGDDPVARRRRAAAAATSSAAAFATSARAPSSPRTGISRKWKSTAPPAASPSARAGIAKCAAPESSATTRQGIKNTISPAGNVGERARRRRRRFLDPPYHSVRRVFPSTAGRRAYQARPSPSFEVRSAPRSHPTEADLRRAQLPQWHRARRGCPRRSRQLPLFPPKGGLLRRFARVKIASRK